MPMDDRRAIFEAMEALANEKVDLSDLQWDPQVRMTPYGEQDDNGVDVSLIRQNLRLSPRERILQADRIRAGMLHLREHARRIEPR
jgi:hypothetical protein